MKKQSIQNDIAKSRAFEMKTYLNSMKAMYENAVVQNGEVYDITFELTDRFAHITKESILEDSRIIKTLRYAVAPTISQMKFGQMLGISSVDTFERSKIQERTPKHARLTKVADKIAGFANEHLDRTRFSWIGNKKNEKEIAFQYAKNWTCSLAADQNAQTAYRNWRKELQEQAITAKLVTSGYVRSGFSGIVSKNTDIGVGEYTKEVKVKGRTTQKADMVFREKQSKKLVLVEAKAVGVEIDATKRIKECCDKKSDWSSSKNLADPEVVTVIAGFFTTTNIENLYASGIRVVWEHRLDDLCGRRKK